MTYPANPSGRQPGRGGEYVWAFQMLLDKAAARAVEGLGAELHTAKAEMPYQYKKFSIKTWVENVYRLFTDRNFEILDEDGRTIGYARSVWAMISQQTRKPADLLTLHGGSIVDYVCDKECPIEKPSRIKVDDCEPDTTYEAKYSDIDINGHVNSIKYIERVLDLFPLDMYKEKRIKRFEVAYVAESYYGDTLSFYKQKINENEYNVEIKKNGGEVVCRSKMIFIN